MKPNCEECRYRFWIQRYCDIHIDEHDCDKKGQDLCKKMNDPDFIRWINERKENE